MVTINFKNEQTDQEIDKIQKALSLSNRLGLLSLIGIVVVLAAAITIDQDDWVYRFWEFLQRAVSG